MADSSNPPISPVTATSKPELTISAASVNNEPAELDGTPLDTPTSPDKRRGSRAHVLESLSPEEQKASSSDHMRAKAISDRKDDPAVLAEIPQTPGAEELEKSGAVEEDSALGPRSRQ